jgi:hypothetical protein
VAKFTVTKLEAVVPQIETAVDLWFHDCDPIPIHTLTAAAHRIVLDLLEHQGKTTLTFDTKYIKPGREQEYKRLMRKAETFFKHAKDDPDGRLKFNPESTETYLFTTIIGYKELIHRKGTPLMELFSFYFCLRHPDLLIRPLIPESEKLEVQKLVDRPRTEFFNEFLPLFVSPSARRLRR